MLAEILAITILGVSEADAAQLQKLFATPATRVQVEETIQQIEQLSYFRVEDFQVADHELMLNLSQRYPVEKIVLKGNWAFLDSTLLNQLTVFPGFADDTKAISQLTHQIEQFYHLEGYLDARVRVQIIPLSYTSILEVHVDEGTPYVITDVNLEGSGSSQGAPLLLPGSFFVPGRILTNLEQWKGQALASGYSQAYYVFSYERNDRTFPGFAITSPFKTFFNMFNQRRGVSVYIGLFPGERLNVITHIPEGVDRRAFLRSLRLEQRTAIDDFEIPLLQQDVRHFLQRNGFAVNAVHIEVSPGELTINVDARKEPYAQVSIETGTWQAALEKELAARKQDGVWPREQVDALRSETYRELLNRSVEPRVRFMEREQDKVILSIDMRFPRLPLSLEVQDNVSLQGEAHLKHAALMSLYELYATNERTLDDPQLMGQRVRHHYLEAGYLDAVVRVERHVTPTHVGVIVRVEEGPRYHSEGTLVFGATSTSRRYIRRLVGHQGTRSMAPSSAVDNARRNIEGDAIFSYSQYNTIRVDGKLYHVIEAEDRENLFGAISLGYDSAYRSNLQYRIGYANMLGRGGELTATQRFSEKRSITSLEYHETNSFGLPIDTSYVLSRTGEIHDTYTADTQLFSIMVLYLLQERLPLSTTYTRTNHSYRSVHSGLIQGTDYWPKGSYDHLGFNLRKDGTDNMLSPTSGYGLQGAYSYSASKTKELSDYHTTVFKGSYYLPPWPGGVIALHGEAGQMSRADDNLPIPLESRFRLGGANSVRGFKHDAIASRSSAGARLGGLAYDRISLEYRHFFGNVELVAFYDLGNVYGERLMESTAIAPYSGIGTGLRYRTPVGPIRLDIAKAQSHSNEASDFEIYLTIGYSF